ncbi:pyridoxine synthesis protein PDX2 [Daldinia caldariorum]|uniref:pyridoxine synthesis protein PDX2 n=1 Tax=Daldinia caldariorum TaxID=326644 RepID=UPI0020084889|nr:pyridoxine synthesis protein PDX2 [Daldinia caldariorum]KAI1463011.1 pyridoxine synthesis protein PDX2 [Daldinia caldariorum]
MVTIGVLALQGGFSEHLSSLRKAATRVSTPSSNFTFTEVRTPEQLAQCDALIIPGGESTTLSLVAAQSGLLEPLREFVKVNKKPTWGTCAGLIFLSEQASAAKRGGQELIGGLNVKVHRNHFGRQKESFVTDLELPFLSQGSDGNPATVAPFPAVFIRAPVVDQVLTDDITSVDGEAENITPKVATQSSGNQTKAPKGKVEILATLPGRHASNKAAAASIEGTDNQKEVPKGAGDIVALRQENVFGTSFHPELTDDIRIHVWWLEQVAKSHE